MFYGAVFTDSLILRDSFKTNKVETMQGIFNKCVIGNKFRLGDCFDTSNVKDFRAMFYYFEFPVGFEFPRCFTTKNALIIDDMFYCAKFPDNFSLDIECNIKSRQLNVFENCYFPKGFSFGSRFSVASDVQSKAIFDDCYVNDKMLHSVLPCNYAIDVVKYLNDTLGRRYCMTINNRYVCKDDLAKHLSQTLNVSKDSVCDAINLFAQKYSDEDSNTESEGMKLF